MHTPSRFHFEDVVGSPFNVTIEPSATHPPSCVIYGEGVDTVRAVPCAHACVRACVRACERASVRACERACLLPTASEYHAPLAPLPSHAVLVT
jgi:hypothetical protein